MNLKEYFERIEQILLENKLEYLKKNQGKKVQRRARSDRTFRDFEQHYNRYHVSKEEINEINKQIPPTERDYINLRRKEYFFKIIEKNIDKKYWQWVTTQYTKENFGVEDIFQVKQTIKDFNKYKRNLKHKDINKYDMIELERELEQLQSAGTDTRSNKQKEKDYKQQLFDNGDAELYYKDSEITIIVPMTEEASCYFGKGTRWCTAGRSHNMFDHYNDQGRLFIIITDSGEKFQFHFETGQFMNEQDMPADIGELFDRYPQIEKAFEKNGDEKLLENLPLSILYKTKTSSEFDSIAYERFSEEFEMEDESTALIDSWSDLTYFSDIHSLHNMGDLAEIVINDDYTRIEEILDEENIYDSEKVDSAQIYDFLNKNTTLQKAMKELRNRIEYKYPVIDSEQMSDEQFFIGHLVVKHNDILYKIHKIILESFFEKAKNEAIEDINYYIDQQNDYIESDYTDIIIPEDWHEGTAIKQIFDLDSLNYFFDMYENEPDDSLFYMLKNEEYMVRDIERSVEDYVRIDSDVSKRIAQKINEIKP